MSLNTRPISFFDTLDTPQISVKNNRYLKKLDWANSAPTYPQTGHHSLVLGIGLKNQNRLIGNSEQSIIDYNRFSACFVRKTEYSFLPNIITVVFR